jgi:O-antigen ligase
LSSGASAALLDTNIGTGLRADDGHLINAYPIVERLSHVKAHCPILAGMTLGGKSAGSARIASWLLFAAVILAPLPLGSNVPSVIAVWCIVLGACLVFAPVRSLSAGQLALAGLAGVVVAAYALVLHEQLAEHPWLGRATPHPIWHEAAAALHMPLVPLVSIARNQPWLELGRPLVCMLAIACGFLIGVDRGRARRLIKLIAWSGAVYAVYGILAHIFDPTHILWHDKEAYLDSVTGTFINRNTAAAYFGSCAVLWSLLLWERARLEMPRGQLEWRAMGARLVSTPSKKVVGAFAMLLICVAAMFMTGSRGGVVVSLLALILAFIAFFWRDLPRRSGLVAALAGGGAVALILLQLIGGGVNARFNNQGLADEDRLETYRSTLRMIANHPWLGTGQGTFAYAFPAYRSPNASVWGVWDMAHNTLLEIAADMGVPIATLVVIAWTVIFAVLVRGALVRRRGLLAPVAALAVATLAVLHSLIDFTLQIPGYAIVALSLIGAGLAQSFPENRSQNGTTEP